MSYTPFEKHLGQTCESCGDGRYKNTLDHNLWWVKCDDCGALKLCYEPLPHQQDFHADTSKYRGFFGGYGSGKTRTTVAEILRHVLETPNGMTLMGAATLPQLENTSKKDFLEMVPEELREDFSIQKNRLTMVNGHVVLFRPLDSEQKARSLNLTAFHIEEANDVDYEYFVQLQTRLRNTVTDKHMGIISSNPDNSWIRSEFLLKSKKIYNAQSKYPQDEINNAFSSHIAPTKLNIHLPPTFYEDTAKGKAQWWIERYLHGSFEFAEGMVYPMMSKHIVEDFPIPEHWERLGSTDFGLRDPTTLILGAIDPAEGVLYLYKEYGENEQPVNYHAKKMRMMLDEIPSSLLRKLVADPSGKRKTANDTKSLFQHYAEYGIYFQPGDNRIDAGIAKVFTYLSLGKLKIFESCKQTLKEGMHYRYKPQSLEDKTNPDEKPIDKDNHFMDSLRYMVQELPDNPEYLKNESYSALYIESPKKGPSTIPFELLEDDEPSPVSWTSY